MALQHELDMSFNYEPVLYGTIKSGIGDEMNKETRVYKLLCLAQENDRYLCDVVRRTEGKESLFSHVVLQDQFMFPTLTATGAVTPMRRKERTFCTCEDMIHAQTFPEDYDFICGMSVPPLMIKRIVNKLLEQGVFDVK